MKTGTNSRMKILRTIHDRKVFNKEIESLEKTETEIKLEIKNSEVSLISRVQDMKQNPGCRGHGRRHGGPSQGNV